MLKLRKISESKIIWIDPGVDSFQMKTVREDFEEAKKSDEKGIEFKAVELFDEALPMIHETLKVLIITSSSYA